MPYPKFCSETCRKAGGPKAQFVTNEMLQKAKDAEWRDPNPIYHRPTYSDTVAEQRRLRLASNNAVPLPDASHDG